MNKYRILTVVLAMAFFSVPFACQDRLDIVPLQSLAADQALKTEGDLVGTLIGAYDGLQDTDSYGGDILLLSDIWANRYYLRFRGTFTGLSQIALVTTSSNLIPEDNPWVRDIWGNAYRTINICNIVLANLNLSEGTLRPTANVEGEALFIRGSLYFELARLYGRTWMDGNPNQNLAVPLVLTPSPFTESELTDADYPARATVAAVYAQAKSDLTRAAELLPLENQHYATRGAALAQLSRIALMQGDYEAARDASNEVISSEVYSLNSNFSNLFYNFINFGGVAPDEYVFYMRMTQQDGTNGLNTYYGQTVSSIPGTAGRGDLDVQTPFVNLHEEGDVRGEFFIITNRRLTQKHIDRYGHVPVIRLAEMYLTRAEANFRLGTSLGDTPLNDVNTIRRRAGLDDLASVTLDDILHERTIELAFEGQRLHDIKRTMGTTAGTNNSNGPAWDSPRLILPIPQRERDVNPNLEPNEGYE
jgi:starch-binding outer membrane protein, SusD/RagB family